MSSGLDLSIDLDYNNEEESMFYFKSNNYNIGNDLTDRR